MSKKTNKKNIWYLRVNFFGLLLLMLLFGFYLYQVNEVASLEYSLNSKEKELSQLKQDYQKLSLQKKNWASLAKLRNRSQNLKMMEISSPNYILPPSKEFAQRK